MMTVLRSLLFAPGNHARRLEKALGGESDAVILDLEDAVAIPEKVAARGMVAAALSQFRRCRLYVRVNAMSTEWSYGDLLAVVRPGANGIVVPKIESADQLRTIEWVIGALERERGLGRGEIDLVPIVETALGFSNLQQIAAAGTRARRIAFGAGDFCLDLGMIWSQEEQELLPYRAMFVAASRAAGIEPPLDTVWVDLRDPDGFARSASRAAALGFQGKLCIHPNQVPAANAAFTPGEAELDRAKRVVAAFEQAEAQGLASIQLDGQFIDYPIVERARRTVARAMACAKEEGPSGA